MWRVDEQHPNRRDGAWQHEALVGCVDNEPAAYNYVVVPGPDRLLRAAMYAAVGVGVAAACIVATPLVLGAVGFTSTGVAAGSTAAAWHSAIGIVAKGSIFSLCQSVGAAGLATTTTVGVPAAAGAVGAAVGAAAR